MPPKFDPSAVVEVYVRARGGEVGPVAWHPYADGSATMGLELRSCKCCGSVTADLALRAGPALACNQAAAALQSLSWLLAGGSCLLPGSKDRAPGAVTKEDWGRHCKGDWQGLEGPQGHCEAHSAESRGHCVSHPFRSCPDRQGPQRAYQGPQKGDLARPHELCACCQEAWTPALHSGGHAC